MQQKEKKTKKKGKIQQGSPFVDAYPSPLFVK